jgi:hypothetical protein
MMISKLLEINFSEHTKKKHAQQLNRAYWFVVNVGCVLNLMSKTVRTRKHTGHQRRQSEVSKFFQSLFQADEHPTASPHSRRGAVSPTQQVEQ